MEVIGTAIALGDVAVELAMFGAAIKNAPQVWYEYSAALHNIVNTRDMINEMIAHFPPRNKEDLASYIQRKLHGQLRSCNEDLGRVYRDANGLLKRFEQLEKRPEKKRRKWELGQWIFTMSRRFGFVVKQQVIRAHFETITHAKASMHLLVSLIGLCSVHSGHRRVKNSIDQLLEKINEHHKEIKSENTRERPERPIKLFFFDERRAKPIVKRRHRRRRRHEQSDCKETEAGMKPRDNRNNAAFEAGKGLDNSTYSTAQPTYIDAYDPYGTYQALDLYPWIEGGQDSRSNGSNLLLEAPTEYAESVDSSSSDEIDGDSTVNMDSSLHSQSTPSSAIGFLLSLDILIKAKPIVKLGRSTGPKLNSRKSRFCVKTLSLQDGQYEFTLDTRCTAQSCDHTIIQDIKGVISHQQGRELFVARITEFSPINSSTGKLNSSKRLYSNLNQVCHGECSHTQIE
ncbi:hypothetical protein FOWG_00235 [Fusarium oxysporum f. sp. lycopersici MN25]|nr:hypothetical protein FOWG_00235 [Fusarium oxysporum f. sp. lycopersici MN25]